MESDAIDVVDVMRVVELTLGTYLLLLLGGSGVLGGGLPSASTANPFAVVAHGSL